MSQEINSLDPMSSLNTRGEKSNRPPLQNGVDLGGLVPYPKVQSQVNPGKINNRELYGKFKIENPVLSISDLVLKYKGVPETIVKKVVEGFECLAEIYHLYGLERIKQVPSLDDYEGRHRSYFDKYIDVLKANHLYKKRKHDAVTKLLSYLVKSGDSSLWVSYFKYKTCAFFSAFEGQEIPPPPVGLVDDDPRIIFFHTWVNSFKRKSEKKDNRKMFLSFLMSINQAKMGMPRDVESSILKAEIKCATHLTTIPPPLVDQILEIRRDLFKDNRTTIPQEEIDFHEVKKVVISKQTICNQLKRTVREMYEGCRYTVNDHYEPFYPSTSSNYNRTRGAMGAVGVVMQFIIDDEELHEFLDRELIKMSIQPVIFKQEITRKYGDRGIEAQTLIDPDHEVIGNAINFFDEEFKAVWVKLFDKLFLKAYEEEPYVEPLGLLEALKIRVISKGPPFLYTVLKPLQKFLWGVLKKNSVFQLIGTPITVELINSIIGPIEDNDILVNGDYKASTDNLHSWVSECLANELCDVLNENAQNPLYWDVSNPSFIISPRFREMLIRSLIHHKFQIDGEWKEQQEGQLMGSITSFPFLCLANAAFCRWALELANDREYRLTNRFIARIPRAPLLINGDDCTLKGDRRYLRKCWEMVTSFGGLTSSVGKTFFSRPERPICMINSVAFDYDFLSQTWFERKYINMGILLGKKRSVGKGNDKDQVSYGELGTLHRELFRQCPSEVWPQVSSRFIYYNANTLKSCPNIPWDMPEYLGGPGLVPNKPHSEEDLRCATLLVMNMKSCGGFHSKRLAVGKHTSLQDWVLHQVVKERIEPWANSIGGEANFQVLRNLNGFEYGIKSITEIDLFADWESQINDLCPWESLEDNYSKLYKYLVIETLFRNVASDVYTKDNDFMHNLEEAKERKKQKHGFIQEQKREQKVLRQNIRSWNNVLKDIYNLEGVVVLKDHEIAHEKKDFVTPVVSFSIYKDFTTVFPDWRI